LKKTGFLQPYEKEYFRKDGSHVPVLVGAASFEETGNQGVAFVLDLTDRKRAEEELHQAEVAKLEMSVDARVSERTRIARELQDTLLQSFHGLLLSFQTVSDLLPERPREAKEKFDSAIDQAARDDHGGSGRRTGTALIFH
jgi:signal transduction histidine kinase